LGVFHICIDRRHEHPNTQKNQVSKHLRDASKKIEGKEQLIMAAFAKARLGLVGWVVGWID
jgi:hypothetical protein